MARTRAQTRAQEDAKRRRSTEDQGEDACGLSPKPSSKRQQTSRPSAEDTFAEATGHRDPNFLIGFWTREGVWPREFFEVNRYERALALKRSLSSGSLRLDSATSITPSEVRSAQYRHFRFEELLETKGVFMYEYDQGITADCKTCLMALLTSEQTIPTESLFRDDLFGQTCRSVARRTKERVLRDISPLIVPPAEVLTIYGSAGLKCLIESANEGWDNSILITGITRPKPDYSVGFRREAFTNDQLTRLKPFVGNPLADDVSSFFMGTYYMYFPFLACEVKGISLGINKFAVAERQNAHSMALAARGIVELFRLVGRENEVHRQILSFSVAHDYDWVQIYGCYPVIDGKDTKYYRHLIRSYSITNMDGKEKWTAYRFVKNIYDNWMPDHFKRICSAIDQLPSDLDFQVPALSESNGLSQDVGSQLELSEADPESLDSLRMDTY